jgi:hypothetical protein
MCHNGTTPQPEFIGAYVLSLIKLNSVPIESNREV